MANLINHRVFLKGALTHGDRRATESRDLSQFHVDHRYGKTALDSVMKYIQIKESHNMPVEYPTEYKSNSADSNFQKDALEGFKRVGLILESDADFQCPPMSKFLNR